MKRVLVPLVGVAMAVIIPFRAWRRARRSGLSLEAAFQAISDEAWADMSPTMKAEIDPDRVRREVSTSLDFANPS
jgi:hypothetical protein